MHFLIFSVFSALLTLPLIPILARVGLSVCPIMREHGFLFGCGIHTYFVIGISLLNLVVGNGLLLVSKKNRWISILGLEPSVFLSSLFFILSSIGLIVAHAKALSEIGSAGSPYSTQISAILYSAGVASVLLQSALLDYFMISNAVTSSSERSKIFTQLWNGFLNVGGPILVLGGLFVFSLLLFDGQVDGFSSLQDQRPWLLGAGVLFIVWYICYFATLSLGKKVILNRFVAQAQSLLDSTSSHLMPLSRTAELFSVAGALNKSGSILSERSRLISNFSKFVSDRLIEQVVQADEVSLSGQHVNAAIVMTDLRDFTSISQSLSPSQVVKMLNIYFQDMIEVLHRNELIVDKFIGDGLLAYCPSSSSFSSSTACEKSVLAGMEMIAALEATNRTLLNEGLPALRLGIGIHVGDVVLGAMGSRSRMQYTIIGDSVNRSARLEALCKELDTPIVISDDVFKNLSKATQAFFSEPMNVKVKGIDSTVVVRKLLASQPNAEQVQT